ncbi:MAG: WecB/TagA/CpsF family glycosyltransferase [Bacillota bacterium]|jgi:N-acetylglucosaminyldiphosphoundecaprenol N-acetyl-beta-D-mannosaminyltransferase
MSERVKILGTAVDVLTMESAVQRIAAMVEQGSSAQVVTANAEILYMAQRDPALYLVLHDAGLVTADGMGVVLASRILGRPLPERVAGCDLVYALAGHGAKIGWNFYLLGAKPEVVEAAVQQLRQLYPLIQIVGWHHGYFSADETSALLAEIKASKPDILLVAMGAPKQDIWLHENLSKTGAAVGIGVGGSFDILAGTAERAPLWMQRAGLEWLFRLLKEPSRIGRMLALPRFVWSVLWQRWNEIRG